ncbi:hypothetical protein [Demequina sp.]|uniref:hypothetical protein n=1 Tax=Demequina sp. TaxID=2050685 RepID=UPI003D09BEDD
MKYVDMPKRDIADAATFHLMLFDMGLHNQQAARLIGVPGPQKDAERTVSRWREGLHAVPVPVWTIVAEAHALFEANAQRLIEARRAAGADAPPLVTYRSTNALYDAVPETFGQLPVQYHWALMLRVSKATGARVEYAKAAGE